MHVNVLYNKSINVGTSKIKIVIIWFENRNGIKETNENMTNRNDK